MTQKSHSYTQLPSHQATTAWDFPENKEENPAKSNAASKPGLLKFSESTVDKGCPRTKPGRPSRHSHNPLL